MERRDQGLTDHNGLVAPQEITGQKAIGLMRLPFSDSKPAFFPASNIEHYAERIGQEVTPHLLRGVQLFMRRKGLSKEVFTTDAERQLWVWAAKASKYNAVYYISRREASENLDFVRRNAAIIDSIGEFIDNHGGVTPIANFALHSYVQGFAEFPGRSVKTAKKSIPRHAIQGYDQNTVVVRKDHFLDQDPNVSFNDSLEIHDWHDLAHIFAASLSSGAFGAKYHDGLDDLPRYYQTLTEGKGMQDASGPPFSDGMLFTQLSRPVFEFYEEQRSPDGTSKYSYDEIQRFVAQELFAYLGGGYGLHHPSIGAEIKAGRVIDPLELAVGEQNKRYERRAAEVEKELFVRGTPDGPRGIPDKDPLLNLTRSQRIQRIADLGNDLLYFEARNLTRHRAHEDALGQFANHLLGQKRSELEIAISQTDCVKIDEDIRVLEATVAFYQMEDLKKGEELNLYKIVGDIIKARKNREKKVS